MAYSYLHLALLLHVGWWIRCTYTQQADSCSNGAVRLANKVSYLEGRIEVCRDNHWGTVCDDKFDDQDANVACKQLGFSDQGATAFEGAKYGEGDGLILLDDLTCTGSEGRLVDCLQVNDCEHNEDAGVKCLKPQGVLLVLNGQIYTNNSIITAEEIAMFNSSIGGDALSCITDKTPCCSQANTTGNWYFPNASIVPTDSESAPYTSRGSNQTVNLNYQGGSFMSGVYRCEVPDQDDVVQNMYIGIYSNTSGGSVSVSSIAYKTHEQTLVCTTSRGPATTVVWLKDNTQIDTYNSSKYEFSQVVMDTVTATYENKLVLLDKSDKDSGEYTCKVQNARNTDYSSINISVCRDGETKFVEKGRVQGDEALRICSNDKWLALTEHFVMEETQGQANLKLRADTESITFIFNSLVNITKYEMKCSTSVDTVVRTVTSTILEPQQNGTDENFTTSLPGLAHSTDYYCCVTLFYDIEIIHGLQQIDSGCNYITTESDKNNNSLPTLPCTNQPNNSDQYWLIIALGVSMIVVLLVLVVLVAAWILSCSKRSTILSPGSNTEHITSEDNSSVEGERHVTNPIYCTMPGDETVFAANPIYGSATPSPISLDNKEPTYALVDDFVKKDMAPQNHYSSVSIPVLNPTYGVTGNMYSQLKRPDDTQ